MYKSPGTETQLAWGNAEQAAQLHHNPGQVLMEPDSAQLTAIIRIKVADLCFELGFCDGCKGLEDVFDIRLFGKRKKPCVPSEVVNQDKIISIVLGG